VFELIIVFTIVWFSAALCIYSFTFVVHCCY